MELPRVYIVILNWNGLGDTIECVESVEKLRYPNVQIVVVDNGSSSGEADVLADKFANIDVLPQPENLGFCGGCNVGIRRSLESGAHFVILLNNDTLVTPELVDRLLDGFDKLPSAGAVSPLILTADDRSVWFADARWDAAGAQFQLSRADDNYEDLKVREPYRSEFACGCCVMFPAEVLRSHGLLDERYFAFYDEADWCYRVRKEGLESYVVPSAMIYHKVSRSTPRLVSTYLMTRNRMLWMKENLTFRQRAKSWGYLAKEFLWHFLNANNLASGRFYSRSHSKAVLLGYRDYFLRRFGKWRKSSENLLFS